MSNSQEEIICNQLLEYVRNNIADPTLEMSADTSFRDVGFDSVSIIDMVLFIERKFGVAIPDTDLVPENLRSVTALAQCALKYL